MKTMSRITTTFAAMGSRLSCSCPDAYYCYGNSAMRDEQRLRIHAELFELSADATKWVMVEPRLLHITATRYPTEDKTTVTAMTSLGKLVLETTINPGQRVQKSSDCFVFFRESGTARTIGVNTLTARDAAAFLAMTAPPQIAVGMQQHNLMAQVSIIGEWNGTTLVPRERRIESTMVSVNPISLVFHYNCALINIDLLDCFATPSTSQQNLLHLAYNNVVYELDFNGDANKFIVQVLNMSSLLMSRTTCTEVAVSFLQRQKMKTQEKLALFKYHSTESAKAEPEIKQKLLLKELAVQQRIAAIMGQALPLYEDISPELSPSTKEHVIPEAALVSIFLIFFNMHNFRMWRKSTDHRMNDLKALCVQPSLCHDAMMSYPSSSAGSVIPIVLPNGKTTVISHTNTNLDELLRKACGKLAVQAELFELVRSEKDGTLRLILREEYEVVKTDQKLGLTIYAHNDGGNIRAEVRGVAAPAPGGPDVGDIVLSVDGLFISEVTSAADVEKLLREGRVIRLRRRDAPAPRTKENEQDRSRIRERPRMVPSNSLTREILAPPPASAESRAKMEEKLVRGIDELLQTEKKYVVDLREMIERFLCIRAVRDIMESALRLQKIQTAFLESLEEAIGDVTAPGINIDSKSVQIKDAVLRVCALFVNRCADFKVYAEYSAAYLRLQQELPNRKDMLAGLEAANRSGEQHCSYESRMIKPIQRVVQYPLILRAIQSGCEQGSLEARQVDAAIHKMQTLAEYVNEMQRIHEQYTPHIDIVRKSNEVLLKDKGLRLDVRDLIIFAHIRWLNAKVEMQNYVIFVFQTLVLLMPENIRRDCKSKHMKVIPINEVELDEGQKEDGVIVLIHLSLKAANGQISHSNAEAIYHLSCCQPQLKQQLLKCIRKARTNFVRETRRPLSGSSQSDGGYGSDPSKERKGS